MTIDKGRRRLLVSAATLAGVSALGPWARAQAMALGNQSQRAFTFEGLVARAQALAKQPYRPPPTCHAEVLARLDYEAFMGIHTRPGKALWAGEPLPFAIDFFPLDTTARDPVAIHVVDHGTARLVSYDPTVFSFDDPAIARIMPDDLGYAGFRVLDRRTGDQEWLAFKGSSYFRSPGPLGEYGQSARGLAVNTGESYPESFPRFTAFWLYKPQPGDTRLTLCALLEGAHVTGAYRMRCTRPGDVIMDIESRLFQRTGIDRLGIAPLTSMYWYSETNARFGTDWRPEVHDSDGLAMATGHGEHLWRALDNPPRPDYSAFAEENPRGFGLMQRDRNFDHYQDPAVSFERRPSTWVEPRGDWGKGHVGLFEFPTRQEIVDNVGVFWVPAETAAAGTGWRFDYRLYWCRREPHLSSLARVVATRTGRAGKPGTYDRQPPLARKFVLDFEGGPLETLRPGYTPEARVSADHGEIVNPYTVAVTGTARWRAFFDWRGPLPPNRNPVVLRCAMFSGGRRISESWIYAYFPHPLP